MDMNSKFSLRSSTLIIFVIFNYWEDRSLTLGIYLIKMDNFVNSSYFNH